MQWLVQRICKGEKETNEQKRIVKLFIIFKFEYYDKGDSH